MSAKKKANVVRLTFLVLILGVLGVVWAVFSLNKKPSLEKIIEERTLIGRTLEEAQGMLRVDDPTPGEDEGAYIFDTLKHDKMHPRVRVVIRGGVVAQADYYSR